MKIIVLLFICSFVNGAKCQLNRKIITRPLSRNITIINENLSSILPTSTQITISSILPTSTQITISSIISSTIPTNIPLGPRPLPREGGGDTENVNKTTLPTELTRILEYILIVENLQNDLYRRYQSIDNTFTDVINSLIGNVNTIRLLNNTVNRPPCTYFFNETSVGSIKAELEKFERIAISMYNSLNIMEGNPLFDLKLRHKTFLDVLTGTFNTPVIPVSLRSAIGIIAGNTVTCNVDIPFVSFFELVMNSNNTRHDEVLTIKSLILPGGRHCAFIGINGTFWSNIDGNKTCKVPHTSYIGMNHVYLVNDTITPVTDIITSSVVSGPALINVLPFDDGTRIISFASSNAITKSLIIILSFVMFL